MMIRSKTWLMVLVAWQVLAIAGASEPEVAFLRDFFRRQILDHARAFSPQFLKPVPPAKIDEIRDQYLEKLGEFKEPLGRGGSYDLLFTKGKAPCKVHLDPDGLVDGFWLGQWSLLDDSPEKLLTELKGLPGTVSALILRDGEQRVFDLDGDQPLAVGSSFKLFVLKALLKAYVEGKARPEQVLTLRQEDFSLPSGILQEWPAGTPMTLAALANLMISVSDNTATDHLMRFLGREAVEAQAPERIRPFMTTLDMFRVKYGDPARAEAFAKADPDGRRAMLAAIATETPTLGKVRSTPFLVDSVEWFVTTGELCRTLYEVRDAPAVSINPGLVDPHRWNRVAYKGGGEPGVLNYTILLQKAPASPTYCLSATINDPARPVAEDRFNEAILRLIGLLEGGAFEGK